MPEISHKDKQYIHKMCKRISQQTLADI